jgi:ubiquinone/menaquinone biosynthesis C-methylase UbiE
MKLNLGCGYRKKTGYINIDLDEKCRPDMICDIKKLPFEDNTVEKIIAYHVLEHFYNKECISVLQEWYRILQYKGILDIEVPDVGLAAEEFVKNKLTEEQFLERLIGADQCANPWQVHLNFFWTDRLYKILHKVGFCNIRKVSATINPKDLRFLCEKGGKEQK